MTTKNDGQDARMDTTGLPNDSRTASDAVADVNAGGRVQVTRAYFAHRQAVLQSYVRIDRGSTHWEGCEVSHLNCALAEGADALRKAGELVQVNAQLVAALSELRINANRLCDRQLGGTYEADCRRSLNVAAGVLTKAHGFTHGR